MGPQNSISKIRSFPYAFTEQGGAMLATVLRTDIAAMVSIKIMDAFIEMRKFLNSNGQVFERLINVEYKLIEHEKNFNKIEDISIIKKLYKANEI